MKTINEYFRSIPSLTDIGDWKDTLIIDNNEPLIDILSLRNKNIIFANQYKKQGFEGTIEQCLLRENVALKLNKIANRLTSGYKLLIYDGLRTLKLQKSIFEHIKSEVIKSQLFSSEEEILQYVIKFVSPGYTHPLYPSPHFTGGAVDLTILGKEGMELNMGTKFDDSSELAYTEYYENKIRENIKPTNAELNVINNRRHLFNLMSEENFTNYKFEWWHYDFGNQLWAKNMNTHAIYGYVEP